MASGKSQVAEQAPPSVEKAIVQKEVSSKTEGVGKPRKTPPPKRETIPGNSLPFKTGDESVDIKPGALLYHTTDAKFSQFAGRPTWFTPFKSEAQGYQENFELDRRENPRTMKVTWRGGNIATMGDVQKVAAKIWPESDVIYSMFDERVGEFESEDVRKFISQLKKEGFSGALIQDYSSRDSNKGADTLAVFDPRESIDVDEYEEDMRKKKE